MQTTSLILIETCGSGGFSHAGGKWSRALCGRSWLMDYPPHREKGHAIGTDLMEASVKQLVAERLKGCGMHWSEAGATQMTALRAQDLNGHWHQTWKTLALVA